MSLRPCLTPSSMQYSDIYIPTPTHHTHTHTHTTPTPTHHTHTPHPHHTTLFTSIFTLAVTPYPAF
ncbi:AFI_G0006380.mRNA.1.CDS.1 [Saccharomyces cerevisiae]|nr:AFI_G0006380.mRNA.1.CDS.1 [Saccharomyces cerevisiae]CAI6526244.1 AFI_G0006380.mRNA.1.CDS.1 [Saccharomyces cerevisiae]